MVIRKVRKMAKLNPTTMKTQYDGQYDTFCRKNHDYGNSFEESLDQFGIVASIVRMSDKMNRLESLTDESKTQQVGSESLLDTLEDLSNYAAMTACWLKGIREEDNETSCGPDMIDVIKYNVQDAKNVMSRSAEMEKEFNKHIPSKVENIDPRNYVLNMLSNIFRVVQVKIDKDEMLVPMDISDEAGLIAKAIVESQTEEEGGAVINNYMCTRKDIPYELKDWIYGIIMRHFYYLKKEQAEDDVINKSYHAVKDLIETCDYSDVKHNESYHKRMLNSLYGAHIFRTPGENWQMIQCENGFKPLGTKIETELPEETIGMYIDRMLSELYSRIDVWSYNDQERYHQFVKFAEDTVKEIIKNDTPISELQKHIDVFPNFSQKDKNALKSRCMKEYNKVEQVSPNDEEEEIKKLQLAQEELITLLQKSFHISCHRQEFTMNREMYVLWDELIDSMAKIVRENNINEKILEDIVFSHNKLDTSAIMHQIKNANKAKDLSAAKDNAREKRGFLMIGHRGFGKGFGTIRELLKDLGLSKEAIREIFDEMEEDDE